LIAESGTFRERSGDAELPVESILCALPLLDLEDSMAIQEIAEDMDAALGVSRICAR